MAIVTRRAKALSTLRESQLVTTKEIKLVVLTVGELALIKQLCLPNKIIAQNEKTSEQVIKNRISSLAERVGVDSRAAIVVKALKLGLVALSDLVYRERYG
jgi:DNA-binding NarL/FixJ family response regulator